MEQNPVTETVRNNKIAMLAHAIAAGVMLVFWILQANGGDRRWLFTVIVAVLGVGPVIAEFVCWKRNHETQAIKHIMAIGFAVFYTFSLFTANNNLMFAFVIPMVLIISIYNDTRYSVMINIGTVLESLIVVIVGAQTGKFGYAGMESAVIQVVVMILIGIYSFFAVEILNKNNQEKIQKVEAAQNKTEHLFRDMSELSRKMKAGIEDIHIELDKLNESAGLTRDAMKEVSVGAADTAEAVQKQILQTESIQNKVNLVNDAATSITENMQQTLSVLEEGKRDVELMVQMVEASVENGADVAQKLETLDKYMSEMNSIVELINGITSQTSLLSLNASIEAARAGEAGKGFAVVATEISGMAAQTQSATDHITELISNVSTAINEVVQVIHQMIEGINEEKQGAANTADSFTAIQTNTFAIRDNAKRLVQDVAELKEANNVIIDSIQTISAISEEVSAHAGDTMNSEEENTLSLDRMKEKMQDLLSQINNEGGEQVC